MTSPGETNAASPAPQAPPPAARYGAVLVPVDGSELAERAPRGELHVIAEKVFDPASVYKK